VSASYLNNSPIHPINRMKKYAITSLAAIVFATGCMGPTNNTQQGAGLGAALGAGLGTIIGHQGGTGRGKGALIGGLAGALLGGAAGNARDIKTDNK
jgi:uncharacterized protein YcfJ